MHAMSNIVSDLKRSLKNDRFAQNTVCFLQ